VVGVVVVTTDPKSSSEDISDGPLTIGTGGL
jgi:hypothetical protein